MRKRIFPVFFVATIMMAASPARFESDIFKTEAGDLRITFFGHASLLFQSGGRAVYVDPDGRLADFAKLPKADLVLVTHQHGDHFDPAAIAALRQPSTRIIVTAQCLPLPAGASTMKNGDKARFADMSVEAVPAYNVVHHRGDGRPFHPRGEGNGYVLGFPGLRAYVAGDTENIPEMRTLAGVDIAFLPMNLPYTMTPEMVADAARMLRPKILYPYHYGDTDTGRLVRLLQGEQGIEIRIRKMS